MAARWITGAFALCLVVGCASQRPEIEPVVVTDTRTPLRQLADSASLLVQIGVGLSDSASLNAQLATVERDTLRRRQRVGDARRSAATARESYIQAIEKGDRLREYLRAMPSSDDAPKNFARYWTSSRYQLDVARAKSHAAVIAADSLLGCGVTRCAGTLSASIRDELVAAAGSAHEAHSLLRIAMSYIR